MWVRIRKAGWKIGYISDAVIVHWGGQSERNNLPEAVWEKKLNAECLFYKKHYSEQTIRAIRRANIIKAYWRIATLTITMPFARDKQICLNKLTRYKLILKTFKQAGGNGHEARDKSD